LENERKLRIKFLFRAIFATKVLFFFFATIKKRDYSSKKVTFYLLEITLPLIFT